MPRTVELARLTLSDFRDILARRELTPGRRMLKEDLYARFAALERLGIRNAGQLHAALASPALIAALASASAVPGAYLTLLRRELYGLIPRPVPLADFSVAVGAPVSALARRGVKTSLQYLESEPEERGLLYALCDLTRINGIGAVAAEAFYEAGYRSVAAVAGADAETLLAAVTAANECTHRYGAKLGVKDMRFCIDGAELLGRLERQG